MCLVLHLDLRQTDPARLAVFHVAEEVGAPSCARGDVSGGTCSDWQQSQQHSVNSAHGAVCKSGQCELH